MTTFRTVGSKHLALLSWYPEPRSTSCVTTDITTVAQKSYLGKAKRDQLYSSVRWRRGAGVLAAQASWSPSMGPVTATQLAEVGPSMLRMLMTLTSPATAMHEYLALEVALTCNQSPCFVSNLASDTGT